MKLSIISPYPPIKGGISKETELLYYILKDTYKINIFGFKKLYPSFLYPSKNQSDISVTKNNNININYCNHNNVKKCTQYNPFTEKNFITGYKNTTLTKIFSIWEINILTPWIKSKNIFTKTFLF